MLVVPAINLRGQKCVLLRQGDYAQTSVYSTHPAKIAQRWIDQGATFLHIVDLDGAREGRLMQVDEIREILNVARRNFPKVVTCQLGGGLRTEGDLITAFDLGLRRVVIGTKAIEDRRWFAAMTKKYNGVSFLLGLDVKEGRITTNGRTEISQSLANDVVQGCAKARLAGVIYTDVSKEGMMEGPNVDAVTDSVHAIRLPLFVSGGVTTLDDIRKLAQLPLAGCIVGRAIYEGTIHFSAACQLAEASQVSQLFLNDREVTGFYHDHACWNSIRWRDVCAVLAYTCGADDRWEDDVRLGLLTAEGKCFAWDERRNGWQVLLENLPRHIPLQDVNWQERIQSAKSTGRTTVIYKGSQKPSAHLSAWFEM